MTVLALIGGGLAVTLAPAPDAPVAVLDVPVMDPAGQVTPGE